MKDISDAILNHSEQIQNKMKRISYLKERIGQPYQMFWRSGEYQGCFLPVYIIYPDLPRYPLGSDPDNHKKNFVYGMRLIQNHAKEISHEQVEAGDVLACEYNGELHVAIMLDKYELIHVFRGKTMMQHSLKFFGERDKKFFRVNN